MIVQVDTEASAIIDRDGAITLIRTAPRLELLETLDISTRPHADTGAPRAPRAPRVRNDGQRETHIDISTPLDTVAVRTFERRAHGDGESESPRRCAEQSGRHCEGRSRVSRSAGARMS